MKQINWGFIGCGVAAESDSNPAFDLVEGSNVVAVMSREVDVARAYAHDHNVPIWYTDAQALIDDPRVNAVYIATPPSTHATYAIMAMRARKPVYIDSPLAISYEDCGRINHVSHDMHVPCFVSYYRRYLPYFIKIDELLKQQRIGHVKNVHVRLASGEGEFYKYAPQQLDLLQEYFGVITHAEGFSSKIAGFNTEEDSIGACFVFENGIVGSASWCFSAHVSAREDRIELIGDQGLICFSVFHDEPIRLHLSEGTTEYDIKHPQYVRQPITSAVVETLQGKADMQCTSLSATPTSWVIDKILNKF